MNDFENFLVNTCADYGYWLKNYVRFNGSTYSPIDWHNPGHCNKSSQISLAFATWNHLQEEIKGIKGQLNNMEQCYISKKKECESMFFSIGILENKVQAARVLCETACELLDGYAHQDAMVILDDLEEALRGASD